MLMLIDETPAVELHSGLLEHKQGVTTKPELTEDGVGAAQHTAKETDCQTW